MRFVDAPYELPIAEGQTTSTRSWVPYPLGETNPERYRASIKSLESIWNADNFVGVIGFSQGALVVLEMLRENDKFPGLCFVILFSCPFEEPHEKKELFRVPSIHVIGKFDKLILPDHSKRIALDYFTSPQFLYHDGGHCVPSGSSAHRVLVSFVEKHTKVLSVATPELQKQILEEVEALKIIFPDLNIALEEGALSIHIFIERKKVILHFSFDSLYPEKVPVITCSHCLSLHEINNTAVNVLITSLQNFAIECLGSPMLFPLVQHATEFTFPKYENHSSPLNNPMLSSKESEESPDIYDDSLDKEIIVSASALARRLYVPYGSSFKENVVIGLVGKPSAGKSTLFNVITRFQRPAETGSFPFTTIEANTGRGFWASGDVTDKLEPTEFGRDFRNRRLLPLVVKDVAGLVPGAYQGLGKGNKFLNDLLDAQALIHVVDVSGLSDTKGNIIHEQDLDAEKWKQNILSDVRWVYEEIHQWIFGNIIAKWHSVLRARKNSADAALERLFELFSGYHNNTKQFLTYTLSSLELSTITVTTWTRSDVHNLVAVFLRYRFPIVLALNKVDKALLQNNIPQSSLEDMRSLLEEIGFQSFFCAAKVESDLLTHSSKAYLLGSDPLLTSQFISSDLFKLVSFTCEINGQDRLGVLTVVTQAVQLVKPLIIYLQIPALGVSGQYFCLQMKSGGTISDVYEKLKSVNRTISGFSFHGEFVRAEVFNLSSKQIPVQVGKEYTISTDMPYVRIFTNKKISWQRKS